MINNTEGKRQADENSYVSTRSISESIEIIESKLKNTLYPTVFDRECDEIELHILKLVLEMNKGLNVL